MSAALGRPLALTAIFAISFALLVNEIMLSAIFHVLLGAGTTVAAISIALVGLSGGGIVAYTWPALRAPRAPERLLVRLVFVFAVTLLASVYVIMAVPISHGDLVYSWSEPSVQLWRLVVYHVTVAPFFVGGIAVSVILRSDPPRVGGLYAADLLGAALGCASSPWLLSGIGAPQAILAAGAPVALLGAWSWFQRGEARAWLALPALLLAAGPAWPPLLSFSSIGTMGRVEAPQYRRLPIEAGDIAFERWALDAWTIVRREGFPQQWEEFRGWGPSPVYTGPVPATRLINYNARFSTYVTDRSGDPDALRAWLDADLSSFHHLLGRRHASVLNIGAGGGREVLAALEHGAERVVAVDVSEVVVEDLMQGALADFSGQLYADPRVEPVADEGRSYAERSTERFDLLEFSIVGGMNLEKMDLVRVDDLFTQEALHTYLERLEDDGVFSYVMYSTRSDLVDELASGDRLVQPYIPALRTFAGLRLALEAMQPGARFADHALVAAIPRLINPRYDLVHIVVSRSPFSEEERARFLALCERLAFEPLHPTATAAGTGPNLYTRIARAESMASLGAALPFSIRPATDDRPFQYALGPGELGRALRRGELFALLRGNPLVSMGLGIGGLALLLTAAPLLLSGDRRRHLRHFRAERHLLAYFACIGFGYMAVEISVLLRLQSYLGKPIYGLSVALFSFLLASGLGSALSGRVRAGAVERAVHRCVGAIMVAGGLFAIGAPFLFEATLAATLPLRIALAMGSVFPLALVMGMLFPLGIRLIADDDEALVPWAWATNGCFSVLGIFSTRIVALLLGFSRALVAGLLAYALVSACLALRARAGGRLRAR